MARTAKRYKDDCREGEANGVASFCVGIYSRLSVDNNERKSESVKNQIDIINQFICSNNSNPDREMNLTVYDTYIDRGVSGTSFEREGFERLLQDVKERKINCIIVKDLSRFGRDYLEAGNLIEKILPFLECRFIAVADHFDSMAANAEEGKLTMHIKNLVNDVYAKDISKRVALAREMSAERGSFIGGFAPYGYEIVTIEGVRKLQINGECAEVVRKIYTLCSQGVACRAIITRLYNDKVHRISDYKKYGHVYWAEGEELHQWSEGAIYGMLHNTNYLGNLQQHGVTVNNTHQAIVSIELFEEVQKRMKGGTPERKIKYKSEDTENIYRSILHCGNCGKRMHGVYYRSRVKDERHYAYCCGGAYLIDGRRCEKNYIREEQITALVLEQLRNVLKRQQVRAKDLTMLNMAEYNSKIAEYIRNEKKIGEERECMKKQAGIIYRQYKDGMITGEEYDTFRKNRKEKERYAEKSLEEMKQKLRKAKHKAEEENKFLRSLFKVDKCKRLNIQLVEALIKKITVFPDGVIDIVYKFSDVEV